MSISGMPGEMILQMNLIKNSHRAKVESQQVNKQWQIELQNRAANSVKYC